MDTNLTPQEKTPSRQQPTNAGPLACAPVWSNHCAGADQRGWGQRHGRTTSRWGKPCSQTVSTVKGGVTSRDTMQVPQLTPGRQPHDQSTGRHQAIRLATARRPCCNQHSTDLAAAVTDRTAANPRTGDICTPVCRETAIRRVTTHSRGARHTAAAAGSGRAPIPVAAACPEAGTEAAERLKYAIWRSSYAHIGLIASDIRHPLRLRFNSRTRPGGAWKVQFRPVKRKLFRPAITASESALRLDLDLCSQLTQATFWNATGLPRMHGWRLDAKHSGYSRHAAEEPDDFLISHAYILAATNAQWKPQLITILLGLTYD